MDNIKKELSKKNIAVMASDAPQPVGPYPHARRVGDLIFLSGVGPREAHQSKIPGVVMDESGQVFSHDIEIQTRAVIKNIGIILQSAGGSLEDIVDIQVFLIDMKNHFKKFNAVYEEYFKTISPTRTTIEVKSLPTPIAVEFKVIALAR